MLNHDLTKWELNYDYWKYISTRIFLSDHPPSDSWDGGSGGWKGVVGDGLGAGPMSTRQSRWL